MLHWQVNYYPVLSSTQTFLKSQAESFPEGTCIIAHQQSEGVGRKGDPWQSQSGGLYASFILKPQQLVNELPLVLLRAIYETLNELSLPSLQVKWPNDILIQGKKVSGLLIDSQILGSNPLYYICGFGVNINQQHFSQELEACSLLQVTSKPQSIYRVLVQILHHFQQFYEQYQLNKSGFCQESVSLLPWLEYNEHIEKWKD